VWLRPDRWELRGSHGSAAQPGADPRAGRGDLGSVDRAAAARRPHPRPTAQPARCLRLRRLPASPAAGARGLASRMGVAGRGSGCRRDHRRHADRALHGRLAGVVCRAAGGVTDRLAAAFPGVRHGQGLAAAGGGAATHRRHAGSTRARGLPGAARHHATGMAGQPRPPRGRAHRSLGHQVVAAQLARSAPQGHLAAPRVRQPGRHAARAARGGGGRCRRLGRRHLQFHSPLAVRAWRDAARSPRAGQGDSGNDLPAPNSPT
jgi:hypothetical protein